jgi:DNA-binding IclR family transcriptional regulator
LFVSFIRFLPSLLIVRSSTLTDRWLFVNDCTRMKRARHPHLEAAMTGVETMSRGEHTAVDKALSLLTAFGAQSYTGLGVSELARRAGLSKSTAFRLLGVLLRNGVVERTGSDYRLGPALHQLGDHVYSPVHERLGALLTPFLAELYELTHETVHLAVLIDTEVLYVNKIFGHQRVRSPSRLGGRAPAYCTGVGKVLLAYNAEAAEATLRRGLSARTERTITDPAELRAHLAIVRRDGIAFDDGEALAGLTCVAAPVFGPNGRPVAAISVSGATERFDPQAHAQALRRVCFAAGRTVAAGYVPAPRGGTGEAARPHGPRRSTRDYLHA